MLNDSTAVKDKLRAPIESTTQSPTLVARWPMNVNALSLFLIATVSCAVQASDVNKDSAVTGTYEFIICKGTCSFSDRGNVFATAVVVFFDGVINRKDKERIDPYSHYDPSDVRACYMVDVKAHAQSYLGINKFGVSPWNLNGKTLQFDLFHGIDAGYVVEVDRTGDVFTGIGISQGAGMGAPPPEYVPDTVVGRRLGSPKISACRNLAASAASTSSHR